jgi:glycosyltransferase involved in cell wall biosynthesis
MVFAGSDEILVLSEFWKDAVSERADPDKIRVLPNAVEPAQFPVAQSRTGDDEDGVPHIVFLSNLIERKGVCELVEALKELARTHPGQFRASIAGTGPLRDRIEKLADAHEEISYLGYVSEERKRSLLVEGSIYVLPTYAEGLPIAMLEGMAGANAIVSTGVGSIPEVIDENRGLLVEPGDIDGLTEALATLITAPERRREMAASNRRAVETEYSWNTVRDELIGIYELYT